MHSASPAADPLGSLELPRLYAWRELAILGLLLMDLTWIAPWFHALVQSRSPVQVGTVFIVLSGVIVGAHLTVRLTNYLRLRLLVRRLILAVFFFVAVYGGLQSLLYAGLDLSLLELIIRPVRAFTDLASLVPIEFFLILVFIFTGWRGMNLAQDFIGPLRVISAFRLGFVMFLFYVLFITLLTGSTPILLWSLFLFASLFAIGAARISVLRLLRGGQRVAFERGWLIGLVLVIGGTIGGAALIAEVTLGVAPVLIGIVLRLALALIILLLSPLILLLVLGLSWVFDFLKLEDLGLFDSLNEGIARLGDLINSLGEIAGDYSWILASLAETWQRWGPYVRLLIYAGVLLGLVALIVNRVRIRSQRAANTLVEERKDLALPDGLLQKLQANLLARLEGLLGMINGRERFVRRYLVAARIRRIYADLMDLSADLAHPRLVAQTPLEYQTTLHKLYLGLEPEIDRITRAYIRVRYGEFPEDRSEMEEIETAWQQIEGLGKAKRAVLKKQLKAERK